MRPAIGLRLIPTKAILLLLLYVHLLSFDFSFQLFLN